MFDCSMTLIGQLMGQLGTAIWNKISERHSSSFSTFSALYVVVF